MKFIRIVLNEPHASVEGLYDDRLSGWDIDNHFINEVVNHLTDWHSDYLFHGFRHDQIKAVRFPYSRFIVNAERLWDDLHKKKSVRELFSQLLQMLVASEN